MGVLKLLTKLDFFSANINLKFKHQSRHITPVGVFSSYIILILCGCSCYFFGLDLVDKSDPEISSSIRAVSNPYPIDLGQNTIPLVFGLATSDRWESFIDPSIYQIQVFYIRGVRDNATKELNYTVQIAIPEVCDINKHFANNYLKPDLKLIQNQYCLPESEFLKSALAGNFLTSEDHNFVKFRLNRCSTGFFDEQLNNNTEPKCRESEVIEAQLKNAIFVMQAPSYFIDPKKLDNPFDVFYKTVYTTVLTQIAKLISVDFMRVSLTSDQSLVIPYNEKMTQHFVMKDQVEYLTEDSQNPNTFLQINLNSGTEQQNFFRKYKKIQNVMAEVGGFIKSLTLVTFIVLHPFVKLHFLTALLSSVYKFKYSKTQRIQSNVNQDTDSKNNQKYQDNEQQEHIKQQEKDQFKKKLLEYLEFFKNNQEQKGITNNTELKQMVRISNNMLKQKKKKNFLEVPPLGISAPSAPPFEDQKIWYLLNLIPFIKHRQRNQLKQATELINQKLDLSYIISKLIELEKLKYILLTTDQIKLFNYLPQPRRNLEENDKDHLVRGDDTEYYKSLFSKQKPDIILLIEAFQAYTQINNLGEFQKNQINQQLRDLIDPRIQEVFESIGNEEREKNEIHFFNQQQPDPQRGLFNQQDNFEAQQQVELKEIQLTLNNNRNSISQSNDDLSQKTINYQKLPDNQEKTEPEQNPQSQILIVPQD